MDDRDSELKKTGIKYFCGFPAKEITSYKIGGCIECLAFPKNKRETTHLLKFGEKKKIPVFILGAFTNVLISDLGLRGMVVSLRRMNKVRINGTIVFAQAGALLDNVIKKAVAKGLAGMEKMSGIPGSVGGAIFMNAGAFGQETFDMLDKVNVMDFKGVEFSLAKRDIEYSYRKTKGLEKLVILSATFKLKKGAKKEILTARKEILKKRARTQPLEYPSAGSVFKRPKGGYASKLIEDCGLKGVKCGDAQISPKHSGFIVNTGKACAEDVYYLIQKAQDLVKRKTGICLELEQILLGNFGRRNERGI